MGHHGCEETQISAKPSLPWSSETAAAPTSAAHLLERHPEILQHLPLGFGFHPTEKHLCHYLTKKLHGTLSSIESILVPEAVVMERDPRDLVLHLGPVGPTHNPPQERFVFWNSRARRGHSSGGANPRANRCTPSGFWKATGCDKKIFADAQDPGKVVALKKTLVFYEGKCPKGTRTPWVMHEYRLADSAARDWPLVLCRVGLKAGVALAEDGPNSELVAPCDQPPKATGGTKRKTWALSPPSAPSSRRAFPAESDAALSEGLHTYMSWPETSTTSQTEGEDGERHARGPTACEEVLEAVAWAELSKGPLSTDLNQEHEIAEAQDVLGGFAVSCEIEKLLSEGRPPVDCTTDCAWIEALSAPSDSRAAEGRPFSLQGQPKDENMSAPGSPSNARFELPDSFDVLMEFPESIESIGACDMWGKDMCPGLLK